MKGWLLFWWQNLRFWEFEVCVTNQPTNQQTGMSYRGARMYLKIRPLKLVVKDRKNILKYGQDHVGHYVFCVDCQTFSWQTNRLTNQPTDKHNLLLRCVSAPTNSTSMFAKKVTKGLTYHIQSPPKKGLAAL